MVIIKYHSGSHTSCLGCSRPLSLAFAMFGCESNGISEGLCDSKYDFGCEHSSQSVGERKENKEIRQEKRLQSVTSAAGWLQARTNYRPLVAVICGSGLGSFADCVKNAEAFEYSSIPHFATCTVSGHIGRLVFGSLDGVEVVVMQGRIHAYEDHSMWKITFPVRVLASLGVRVLIATNACGAMNPEYNEGDLVIIRDHINLPGLGALNPLKGLYDDRFGTRFPCMTDAYDRSLRLAAWQVGRRLGFQSFLREGISVILCGPSFETPAELRMMRTMGADVVGMSTAPEVIVARQCGMLCFSLALVTNACVMIDDDTSREDAALVSSSSDAVVTGAEAGPSHEEVLDSGLRHAQNIELFFRGLISEIATMLRTKTE